VGTRFSETVQTCPEARAASYKMGTGSLSKRVKRPGRDVIHLPPSSSEVGERVELDLHSPPGPSWPVLGPILFSYLLYSFYLFM
jgi:hypothetical protein